MIKNFEISRPELSYLSLLDNVYKGLYEREAGNKRRKISRLLALKTEKGSQAKECRLPLKLKCRETDSPLQSPEEMLGAKGNLVF